MVLPFSEWCGLAYLFLEGEDRLNYPFLEGEDRPTFFWKVRTVFHACEQLCQEFGPLVPHPPPSPPRICSSHCLTGL